MKRESLLAFLLALALALCLGLAACESGQAPQDGEASPSVPASGEPAGGLPANPVGTRLGDGMAELTFTACDGRSYSLYETLREKKMVLLNVWATWCGPCRAEFPYMTEAYEQYKDDIEIFALSCEPGDTDELIASYVSGSGITFPVGRDAPGVAERFHVSAVPTSIIVDRFGTICFMESGAITSVEAFQRLFDVFLADGYSQSVILEDGIPPEPPGVAPEDPAVLAAALGGGFTYSNPDGQRNWPLVIQDGCAVSTNAGQSNTVSALDAAFSASAGDVFAVDYAVSSEAGCDYLTICVNGKTAKYASGERGWTTFVYECPQAGDYTVTLAYEKDGANDGGGDLARFKNVRLLTGGEAAALLSSQPVYPYGEETTLTVTSPGAREVLINDPDGALSSALGDGRYYIIPGESASFSATLAQGLDAECASFFSCFDGDAPALSGCVADGRYEFATNGADSYETTGTGCCCVGLIPARGEQGLRIFFFRDEANLNAFLARSFTGDDGVVSVTWKYADGSAPETAAVSQGADALEEGGALYYLVFVDQNGDPVEGVLANVCDDSACIPMKTGANGVAAFAYPGFAYHVQVVKVPDGYDCDLTAETYLDAGGGVTEFVLTKS